jgi:hypothetical protein
MKIIIHSWSLKPQFCSMLQIWFYLHFWFPNDKVHPGSFENTIYTPNPDQQQTSSAPTLTFRISLVSFKTDSNKHLHPRNFHIFLLERYFIETLFNSNTYKIVVHLKLGNRNDFLLMQINLPLEKWNQVFKNK